jgi:hypothetical protein
MRDSQATVSGSRFLMIIKHCMQQARRWRKCKYWIFKHEGAKKGAPS